MEDREVIRYIQGVVRGTLGSVDQSPEHKDENLRLILQAIEDHLEKV
jgi:hypothetical protein